MKLHHIGLAVKDLEKSMTLFSEILGGTFSEPEEIKSEKVKASFSGEIELLQATDRQSPRHPMMQHPILNFLERNGEGVHHLCYEVGDLDKALERLSSQGIEALQDKPGKGCKGSRVIFLNPKHTNNVLIELMEVAHD